MITKYKFILALSFIISTSSQNLYADGVDNIRFICHDKVIANWTENAPPVLDSLLSGDTLIMVVSTDWGGEYGAYIELQTDNNVYLDSLGNSIFGEYSGTFRYVLDLKKIRNTTGNSAKSIKVILHYRSQYKLDPVVTAIIPLPSRRRLIY